MDAVSAAAAFDPRRIIGVLVKLLVLRVKAARAKKKITQ